MLSKILPLFRRSFFQSWYALFKISKLNGPMYNVQGGGTIGFESGIISYLHRLQLNLTVRLTLIWVLDASATLASHTIRLSVSDNLLPHFQLVYYLK